MERTVRTVLGLVKGVNRLEDENRNLREANRELASTLGRADAEVTVLRVANQSLGRRVLDYQDIMKVQQEMLRQRDGQIASLETELKKGADLLEQGVHHVESLLAEVERLQGFKKAHDEILSIPGVIEIVTQYTVQQELNKKLDELVGAGPQKAPEEPLPEAQVPPMAEIGAIFAAMGAF